MFPQKNFYLAEADFARRAAPHYGSHLFHDVPNSFGRSFKALVVVLWFNPTATIEKYFDHRQQPLVNGTSQDAIVLLCERFAKKRSEPKLSVQQFFCITREVVVLVQEMSNVTPRQKIKQMVVPINR